MLEDGACLANGFGVRTPLSIGVERIASLDSIPQYVDCFKEKLGIFNGCVVVPIANDVNRACCGKWKRVADIFAWGAAGTSSDPSATWELNCG